MTLPVIAVVNQSSCLADAEVAAALPDFQKQVTDDFRGFWGMDCTLTMLGKNDPLPAGWWQIVVLDDPDQAGALGYHELSSAGTPLGKVFAGLDLKIGASWTVTFSHELLEMLADPWINLCAEGSDGRIYALEVCDACESDSLGYVVGSTLVSDFVTPSWFEPTEAKSFDFKGHLSQAFELASGGYISILESGKGWTQVTKAQPVETLAREVFQQIPAGCRRDRRMTKGLWKRSTA